MIKIFVIFLTLLVNPAVAHDDPDANHSGGPCWIWELPTTPAYCIFIRGTRHEHPYPEWLEDRPTSDV